MSRPIRISCRAARLPVHLGDRIHDPSPVLDERLLGAVRLERAPDRRRRAGDVEAQPSSPGLGRARPLSVLAAVDRETARPRNRRSARDASRDPVEHGADRRRRAEEERARDPVDDDFGSAARSLVVGRARSPRRVGHVLGRERQVRRDRRRLRHAVDEQERSRARSRRRCASVRSAEDRQQEGREQHEPHRPATSAAASRRRASRPCSRRRRRARRRAPRAG